MQVKRLLMAFLFVMSLTECVIGDENVNSKYIYTMDQSVNGNGFYSSHRDIATSELLMSDRDHGSGRYEGELKYSVQNKATYSDNSENYVTTDEQNITSVKVTDFAFAPIKFNLGKSFSVASFKSKGQEETNLKNYIGSSEEIPGGSSMSSLYSSLDVLSGTTSAQIFFKSSSTDDILYNYLGSINLSLDSAFSGRAHIGALNLDADLNRDVLVDEDYSGTFTLHKDMREVFRDKMNRDVDHWLPCCSYGWTDMEIAAKNDFGSNVAGVFDCTCFSLPESGLKA